MLDPIIGIFAPHICLVCGVEGSLLCAWCLPDAIPVLPERCYRCNSVSQDSAVCKKCRADSRLKFVWARGQYGDVTKTLIYQLKFGRKKAAARVIARLLDESVPFLPKDTLITYVPTATSRVRVRGYDQSRLIAKELSKLRGLTMSPLLVRLGQTRQVGATRKQRIKQASNNYRLTNKRVTGQNIVIIDDILTTGATVEAAAKLLKQAGAKQVNAAVFAQK